MINETAQRYAVHDLTGYVCVAVLGTYGISEILNGECFSNWVPVAFEGRTYHAPIGWDEVLSHLYGDYMTLPPEKDRVTHHSNVAYWKAWGVARDFGHDGKGRPLALGHETACIGMVDN